MNKLKSSLLQYAVQDYNDIDKPYTLFVAIAEPDYDRQTFFGKVTKVNGEKLEGEITFQSDDPNRLQEEFQKSVEDWLEFSNQLGR